MSFPSTFPPCPSPGTRDGTGGSSHSCDWHGCADPAPWHLALVPVGFPAVGLLRLRDPGSGNLAVGQLLRLGDTPPAPRFSIFPFSCLPSETDMVWSLSLATARVNALGPHCHSQWGAHALLGHCLVSPPLFSFSVGESPRFTGSAVTAAVP